MESKERLEQDQIEAEGDSQRDFELQEISEPQVWDGEPEEPEENEPDPEPGKSDGDAFDVSPSDLYAEERPDYNSLKKSGLKNMLTAAMVVLAIIALTWYACRQDPRPETEPPALPRAFSAPPEAPAVGVLPEKAPDAVDFSPTPETRAAAEARRPAPPVRQSPAPPTDKKAASASSEVKAAETKAETAPVSAETGQAAENKAEEASAEPVKAAATEPEGGAATENQAKAASAERKAADGQAKSAPPEAKSAESQPEAVSAENQAAASSVPAIADLWVVNISSTPDAAESLPLLTKAMAAELGGQVYAYEATVEGVTRYRIRVGFFNNKSEAEAVGQKIKEDFKLSSSPWVVKPTVEEVERYRKK